MSGYIVTVAKLTNITPEFREYAAKAAAVVAQYGGSYLVRGPAAHAQLKPLRSGTGVFVIGLFQGVD
jgi:uncharacterized protein (DUF1330 family)